MYEVFLEGIEFYAYHGVSAEEKKLGQHYHADITISVCKELPQSDNVNDTVDYDKVCQLFLKLMRGDQFHTLEALAHRTCTTIMKEFVLIESIELSIAKSPPPIDGIVAQAGIRVKINRADFQLIEHL